MTAPTVQYIEAIQNNSATATPTFGVTHTAAIGDLCVILVEGIAGYHLSGAPTYTSGGADAGFSTAYSKHQSANDATEHSCYYKVLVSADITAGEIPTDKFTVCAANGSRVGRFQLFVFAHVNGWDTSTCLVTTQFASNVGAAPQTVATMTDVARGVVAVIGFSLSGALSNSQQFTWAGAPDNTIRAPYCDESTNAQTSGGHTSHSGTNSSTGTNALQADYQEFDISDTPGTVTAAASTASNSGLFSLAEFQAQSGDRTFTFNDTIGLTDTKTYVTASARTISDTAALTDIMSYSTTGSSLSRLINDTFALTDVVPRTLTFTLSDTLAFTDTGTANVASPESFGLTDTIARDIGRTISDTLGMNDTLSYVVPGQYIFTDRFGLTDFRGITVDYGKDIPTSQINLTDTVTAITFIPPERDFLWTMKLGPARWRMRLISPDTGRAHMLLTLPADTVENIPVEVIVREGGTFIDPSADVVEMAFTAIDTEPDVGDWVAAEWVIDSSHTPTRYFAQAINPGAGTYWVWCRVTDDPEIPVRRTGTLELL